MAAAVAGLQWWYDVLRQTLERVCAAHDMPVDGVVDPVMDELFDDMYFEVFAGPEVSLMQQQAQLQPSLQNLLHAGQRHQNCHQ